jgi:hypothetical protein
MTDFIYYSHKVTKLGMNLNQFRISIFINCVSNPYFMLTIELCPSSIKSIDGSAVLTEWIYSCSVPVLAEKKLLRIFMIATPLPLPIYH